MRVWRRGTASQTTGPSVTTYSTTYSGVLLPNKTPGNRFVNWNFRSDATSGNTRGMHLQLFTAGASAGGEALRVYHTVLATQSSAVHGAHISVDWGTAGSSPGSTAAVRSTLHVPNSTINMGTSAVQQAEIYADGPSSNTSSTTLSFFRVNHDGDATGKATLASKTYLFNITSTDGSGNMVYTGQSEPTWTNKTCYIKCLINGVNHWLVAFRT